jgi:hypothetical protein
MTRRQKTAKTTQTQNGPATPRPGTVEKAVLNSLAAPISAEDAHRYEHAESSITVRTRLPRLPSPLCGIVPKPWSAPE